MLTILRRFVNIGLSFYLLVNVGWHSLCILAEYECCCCRHYTQTWRPQGRNNRRGGRFSCSYYATALTASQCDALMDTTVNHLVILGAEITIPSWRNPASSFQTLPALADVPECLNYAFALPYAWCVLETKSIVLHARAHLIWEHKLAH